MVPEDKDLKFCVDCLHFKPPQGRWQSNRCKHPNAAWPVNLVYGYREHRGCSDIRQSSICGVEAKLFEKRPSVKQKLMLKLKKIFS